MNDSLNSVRREFAKSVLEEQDLPADPFILLREWVQTAIDQQIADANAMALSTLDSDGFPTSRIVLLRDVSDQGLSFFTNYQSAKGQELKTDPKASLMFFWSTLERQIRIRGRIQKLSPPESDAYFASRPRESQIGAWASPQSHVIANRDALETLYAEQLKRFPAGVVVPRPPHWGGYRLEPEQFEFWQGRPSRLHDRLRAVHHHGAWCWERLAP